MVIKLKVIGTITTHTKLFIFICKRRDLLIRNLKGGNTLGFHSEQNNLISDGNKLIVKRMNKEIYTTMIRSNFVLCFCKKHTEISHKGRLMRVDKT